MAEKSDTQRRLQELANKLNNLRPADSMSEKNTKNSRLVQASNREDFLKLRGRSGSQGSKNNVSAGPVGFLKQAPASMTGSRMNKIEVPEDFLQDR